MAKARILLPGSKNLNILIPFPDFKGLTLEERIAKVLSKFFNLSFLFVILTFGIGAFFVQTESNGLGYESSAFVYLLLGIVLITSVYFSLVLFLGLKKIADPYGFVPILIFALIVTSVSVLPSTSDSDIAFGNEYIKGTAIVSIMLLIGLYYFAFIAVNTKQQLNRFIEVTALSGLLFSLYSILFHEGFVVAILMIILSPLFMILSVRRTNSFYFYSLSFLGLLLYVVQNDFIPDETWFLIFLGYSIASTIALVFLILLKLDLIKSLFLRFHTDFKKLFGQKEFTNKSASLLLNFEVTIVKLLILISPLLFISGAFIIYISKDNIGELLQGSFDTYTQALDTLKDSEKNSALFFGLGGSYLSGNHGFLWNALITQGLFGFGAYIFLWLFSLYAGLTNLLSAIRSNVVKDIQLSIAILIIIIVFPILSFFLYLGLPALIFWWLMLIAANLMMNRRESKKNNESEDYTVVYLDKFTRNNEKNIRYLISTGVFLLSLLIMYYIVINKTTFS